MKRRWRANEAGGYALISPPNDAGDTFIEVSAIRRRKIDVIRFAEDFFNDRWRSLYRKGHRIAFVVVNEL